MQNFSSSNTNNIIYLAENFHLFIQEIKNDINSEIELLIHDGKSWEATLPPQYRSSFNAIFNTAFYNMFALDLVRGYLPTDPAREYMHVDSIDLEHVVSTSANNLLAFCRFADNQ